MYGLTLAKNFTWDEVRCKCGCHLPEAVAREAVRLSHRLQVLRDNFGPVTVTSWYRCVVHNRSQGGGRASQHLYGRAADIKCMKCPDLPRWADSNFPDGGVGTYSKYPNMVHVDIRGRKARWHK